MEVRKMKKILTVLVVVGLLVAFGTPAFAQDLKLAYVDLFEIFNEYEKTKSYDKVLEGKKSKEEDKLESKKKQIEKIQSKTSLLKEEEQLKERETIVKAVEEYRQLERDIFTDLKKQRDEKMKEILEDITKVIEDYAKKNGFDMILHKNAVLFGSSAMDVTDQVLKLVNDKYKK